MYYLPTMVYTSIPTMVYTLIHPGYTTIPATVLVYRVIAYTTLSVREKEPWALRERIPWVRVLIASQDLESVKERRRLCAELLRSSREIKLKDWIDEGTSPVYTLRLETSAQSGGFSSGHRNGI